jgi:hypothetical protein
MQALIHPTERFWVATAILVLVETKHNLTVNDGALVELSGQPDLSIRHVARFIHQHNPSVAESEVMRIVTESVQVTFPDLDVGALLARPFLEWLEENMWRRWMSAVVVNP